MQPVQDSTNQSDPSHGHSAEDDSRAGMSYKFQRLREKIRTAIVTGELTGKLPGERLLARRFHVNAKTLSKALTDLAAEGLLDRSIGRGTYVKGAGPAVERDERWLLLTDAANIESPVVQAIRRINAVAQIANSSVEMRPSFLNPFSAVVNLAADTDESLLRDLIVRNIPIVAVHQQPKNYSTHCVIADSQLGATRLGRDMALGGHRKIAAVEQLGSTQFSSALRQSVSRFDPDAVVEVCSHDDFGHVLKAGATAIACASEELARHVINRLRNMAGHSHISVSAVGVIDAAPPCNGYFCSAAQFAEAVAGLLREPPTSRPATLWLVGAQYDSGTTNPMESGPKESLSRFNVGRMLA